MKGPIETASFSKVEVSSAEELRSWLRLNYDSNESIWLVTWKKNHPDKYLSTGDVLDELLCFGWIDGIRRKLDAYRTMQLICKRKSHHWANSYKERAQRLIADGRMEKPGLDMINRSKALGLWSFMEDVDRLEIPADLNKALERNPKALEFFKDLNPSSKRFALRWLKLSKTPETRKRRISELVARSVKGEKLPGS
jgi:uncharacterized protein YdeI (YjbR/CyaY-like superfamily)